MQPHKKHQLLICYYSLLPRLNYTEIHILQTRMQMRKNNRNNTKKKESIISVVRRPKGNFLIYQGLCSTTGEIIKGQSIHFRLSL